MPSIDEIYRPSPDGHGGVKLHLREPYASSVARHLERVSFRDAPMPLPRSRDAFLPGPLINKPKKFSDDPYSPVEEDLDADKGSTQSGQIIATLDPPGEGLTYEVEQQSDGSFAVVIVEDNGSDMNANDRMMGHRIQDGPDPLLARQNRINRARWTRDRRTLDESRNTLFRHWVSKGERLTLEGPDASGYYSLILLKGAPNDDLTGPVPPGAERVNMDNPSNMDPADVWSSVPGQNKPEESEMRDLIKRTTGDNAGRGSEAATLRTQNQINRSFWSRRR